MSYTIERSVEKLWRNRISYFFLALELTIGMTVTLCGFLSSHAAQERLLLFQSQLSEKDVVVEYYSDGIEQETSITYEDYCDLLDQYEARCSFTFFLYTGSIYQLEGEKAVSDVTILCMNADAFSNFFGEKQRDDAVYVGNQVAKDLAVGELVFAEPWLYIDGESAQVGDKAAGQILQLPSRPEQLVTTVLSGSELEVGRLVVLPESFAGILEENTQEQIAFLRLTLDEKENTGFLEEIIEELSRRHPAYTYTLAAQGAELEQSIAELTQGVRLISWVAWLALAITTVGIIGNLFLFLQRRQREYAIAFALGAMHGVILRELICEVLLLTLASGLVATLLAAVLAPVLSTSLFSVVFHWSAVLVMLLTVGTVTLCSCFCTMLGFQDSYPTRLLRS